MLRINDFINWLILYCVINDYDINTWPRHALKKIQKIDFERELSDPIHFLRVCYLNPLSKGSCPYKIHFILFR